LQPSRFLKLSFKGRTAAAMRGMLMLAGIARGDQNVLRKDNDTVSATAPDNIADCRRGCEENR